MDLNLIRFTVGDKVTFENGEATAKFVGDTHEGGIRVAVILLTEDFVMNGRHYAKGLKVKMPHNLLRPKVLN